MSMLYLCYPVAHVRMAMKFILHELGFLIGILKLFMWRGLSFLMTVNLQGGFQVVFRDQPLLRSGLKM